MTTVPSSSGYTLSRHAQIRINQRGITDDRIAGALAGEHWIGMSAEYFYCRKSRLLIVACAICKVVITVYVLSRKQARQMVSTGAGKSKHKH